MKHISKKECEMNKKTERIVVLILVVATICIAALISSAISRVDETTNKWGPVCFNTGTNVKTCFENDFWK
jgi:hypothetical protein